MLHGVLHIHPPHDFRGPAGQWRNHPVWWGLLSLFWPCPPLVEREGGSGGRENHGSDGRDPGFGLVLASNTWLHCLQRQPLVETVDLGEVWSVGTEPSQPWFTEEMSACETKWPLWTEEGLLSC